VLSAVDGLSTSASNRLVIDMSTIDPATAREAAARLGRAGARYVDAPVLGRPAAVGSWTLVAGGDHTDVAETAEIAVGTIAKAVERVGTVGAGSTVKVLNNLMFGAINAITAEVLDLAERANLDPARFVEVVADSGAATVSPLFRDVAPRMAHGDHTPVFSLALLQKDLRLGATLARQLGAPADVTTVVERLTSAAVDVGHGGDDTSSLIEFHRSRRGHNSES
jgi:3-hydroxyisobutyrate dehydrogenase